MSWRGWVMLVSAVAFLASVPFDVLALRRQGRAACPAVFRFWFLFTAVALTLLVWEAHGDAAATLLVDGMFLGAAAQFLDELLRRPR